MQPALQLALGWTHVTAPLRETVSVDSSGSFVVIDHEQFWKCISGLKSVSDQSQALLQLSLLDDAQLLRVSDDCAKLRILGDWASFHFKPGREEPPKEFVLKIVDLMQRLRVSARVAEAAHLKKDFSFLIRDKDDTPISLQVKGLLKSWLLPDPRSTGKKRSSGEREESDAPTLGDAATSPLNSHKQQTAAVEDLTGVPKDREGKQQLQQVVAKELEVNKLQQQASMVQGVEQEGVMTPRHDLLSSSSSERSPYFLSAQQHGGGGNVTARSSRGTKPPRDYSKLQLGPYRVEAGSNEPFTLEPDDLEFTSDEDDDSEYEEEDDFNEWEASEDDDDDSTSSDEENIISVEEGVSLETASMNSGSTSSDDEDATPEKPKTAIGELWRAHFITWPEDLRSDEDLSSGFDEDSSERSSSLEEGLGDAEESVSADDSAQASSNDGGSSYISSEAAEESEDCDSAGQESSEDSTSSGGQAGRQPDFLTPALSQGSEELGQSARQVVTPPFSSSQSDDHDIDTQAGALSPTAAALAILSKMGAGRLPNGVDGLMKPLPASWLALKRVPAKEPEQAVMSQSRPPVSSDGFLSYIKMSPLAGKMLPELRSLLLGVDSSKDSPTDVEIRAILKVVGARAARRLGAGDAAGPTLTLQDSGPGNRSNPDATIYQEVWFWGELKYYLMESSKPQMLEALRCLGIPDEGLVKVFEKWDEVESVKFPNSSPKVARKWGYLLRGLLSLSDIDNDVGDSSSHNSSEGGDSWESGSKESFEDRDTQESGSKECLVDSDQQPGGKESFEGSEPQESGGKESLEDSVHSDAGCAGTLGLDFSAAAVHQRVKKLRSARMATVLSSRRLQLADYDTQNDATDSSPDDWLSPIPLAELFDASSPSSPSPMLNQVPVATAGKLPRGAGGHDSTCAQTSGPLAVLRCIGPERDPHVKAALQILPSGRCIQDVLPQLDMHEEQAGTASAHNHLLLEKGPPSGPHPLIDVDKDSPSGHHTAPLIADKISPSGHLPLVADKSPPSGHHPARLLADKGQPSEHYVPMAVADRDTRLKYRPWMSMVPLAIEFLYSRCCRVVPIDPDGSCDALDITFFMLTCQERQQLQVLRYLSGANEAQSHGLLHDWLEFEADLFAKLKLA